MLLRRVVIRRTSVELVRGHEVDFAFGELVKDFIFDEFTAEFGRQLEEVAAVEVVVGIANAVELVVLLQVLDVVLPHGFSGFLVWQVNPEVQVAEDVNDVMVPSFVEPFCLNECLFEDTSQHDCPLLNLPLACTQMAVQESEGRVIDPKAKSTRPLVRRDAAHPCLHLAQVKVFDPF